MSRAKQIIVKYFQNSFSEKIQQDFSSWIQHNKSNDGIEEILEGIWDNLEVSPDESTLNDLKALKEKSAFQIDLKTNLRRKLISHRIFAFVAAACAAIIVISAYFPINTYNEVHYNKNDIFAKLNLLSTDSIDYISIIVGDTTITTSEAELIEQSKVGHLIVDNEDIINLNDIDSELIQIVVPKGKRSRISFSDGSIAWVNSETKLLYPMHFEKNKREIYVDGEIFLEVIKDTLRPFYVNTQDINIKVLGTSFNINTYSKDAEHSVVLIDGSIEIESENSKLKKRLTPNQGFFYTETKDEIKNVNTYNYTYWKDNEIKLDGEPLEAIFDKLSKYYNRKIIYSSGNQQKQYKGRLFLHDPIENVLHILSMNAKFKFKNSNDTIYIHY